MRTVVVGAGVAGLAAALRVQERAPSSELIVLEAADRIGGALLTERDGDLLIEGGAESFLTEKPAAIALAQRLGFAGDLVSHAEGERRTYVVRGGRLLPLPRGFLLLAPTQPWPVLSSPIFSWPGKVRLALDLVRPRRHDDADESLASFTRRRFGAEALARVVDPLVGGIYTADPERLSIHATLPRFPALERSHGSVIRGLRATTSAGARDAAGARYGLFASHRDGMGAFAAAMAAHLPPGAVRLRSAARAIERAGAGWRVHGPAGPLEAEALVVAAPAHQAAGLLEDVDPALAGLLARIEYASSATVTLAYRRSDVHVPLPGFGFVVPHAEGRDLIACTFLSRKYPMRAPADVEVVRAFVGGARRPEMAELPEAELARRVRADLTSLLGLVAEPVLTRIHRWERAMPQYVVGHLARVGAIEEHIARHPGLALAGAAFRGVGIPDCIRSGEAAADRVLTDLGMPPHPSVG